jgi:adenylate kinase
MEVPLVSTGDMLRRAAELESPLGVAVRRHVEDGSLVPDDVMEDVVGKRLSEKDCRSGFVLDGFPRTLPQAEALDQILEGAGTPLNAVLYLAVDKAVAVGRNLDRLSCMTCGAVYNRATKPPRRRDVCDVCGAALGARADDDPETASSRWDHYQRLTEPLIGYFEARGLLHRIDGGRPAGDVLEDAWCRIGGDGFRHDSPQDPS